MEAGQHRMSLGKNGKTFSITQVLKYFTLRYRDGNPISTETILAPSGRNLRSEIVVEGLSRQDLNSRFTCKAINHQRATPVEASVQLDMNCKLKSINSFKSFNLDCITRLEYKKIIAL